MWRSRHGDRQIKPTGRFRFHPAAVSPLAALLLSPVLVIGTTWALHSLQLLIIHQTGARHVRPINIGYLLPLVIVTALGGRAVGFIALAEAVIASTYALTTPTHTWHIHDLRDGIEEALLCLVGSVVILTVETLRRKISPLEEIAEGRDTLPISQQIPRLACQVEGVCGIHRCRVRRWGLDYYIDLTISVDGDISVRESRRIAAEVEKAVRDDNPLVHRVQVEITPT